ncbi:MAG: hypothetical protein IKC64_03855 [Clostridia bacterium]|nr:hypothetical protein [Clostridia bacterium]
MENRACPSFRKQGLTTNHDHKHRLIFNPDHSIPVISNVVRNPLGRTNSPRGYLDRLGMTRIMGEFGDATGRLGRIWKCNFVARVGMNHHPYE